MAITVPPGLTNGRMDCREFRGCELEKDNRRILTWSLNAGSETYMKDLEMYYHKIYTIGLHEFGVSANGKIYDFRSEQYYFDSSGNYTGVRVPLIIE